MLYVRTSKSIKYKAKSWSDMLLGLPFLRGAGGGVLQSLALRLRYGNFLQKTIGALINLHVNREEAEMCT